jgi:electron transfer flavoprotein alpha subunit
MGDADVQASGRPLQIAALVKQVPRFEEMSLGRDGRLVRQGPDLEMNPYCRRAVAAGVTIARQTGGSCTAVCLGPSAAEDVLREALAWGADDAVLVSDPAFAGSDTLATAAALAATLAREGPFDLVLVGRNSVDADTGQVGPQIAELLDLAFVGGARTLAIADDMVHARLEHDDGWARVEAALPTVVSCAERLCDPCKAPPDARSTIPAARVRRRGAADLGPGPWGAAGSPTRVGEVRRLVSTRDRQVLTGPLDTQVTAAVELLAARGLVGPGGPDRQVSVPGHVRPALAPTQNSGPAVAVAAEPGRYVLTQELLGRAAELAARIGGSTVVLVPSAVADLGALSRWGADAVVLVERSAVAEDVARAMVGWCTREQPWAVLVPSTMWGREVAARLAARLGAGLIGDAIDLVESAGRLVALKPAFGGSLVAAVTSVSGIQLVTVRAGVLPRLVPRSAGQASVASLDAGSRGRVRILDAERDDDLDALARARVVVGVGRGVPLERYAELEPIVSALGAELAATRKVTDVGWLPRARQLGITGRAVRPDLYVAIGLSGRFNHLVGVQGAGTILAVNHDPEAPVFDQCDIGIVGDWVEVVPRLATEMMRAGARPIGASGVSRR